jgi:hypothetical protein
LWILIFNVDPMSSLVCQIEDQSGMEDRRYGRSLRAVQALEEIVLPDSNTAEMCEAFVSRVRSSGLGATVRRADLRRCGRLGAQRGGTLRLRDHPAILSYPARLPCDLSRQEFQSHGARSGECGERDALQPPTAPWWSPPGQGSASGRLATEVDVPDSSSTSFHEFQNRQQLSWRRE